MSQLYREGAVYCYSLPTLYYRVLNTESLVVELDTDCYRLGCDRRGCLACLDHMGLTTGSDRCYN